jgi:hypothetical protein
VAGRDDAAPERRRRAALAAARGAQLNPSAALNNAQSYGNSAAASNRVFGSTGAVTTADLTPYMYYPKTATNATPYFVAGNWNAGGFNTVEVALTATGHRIFSGITGMSAPTVARSARVWIANVNSGTCITPWGLPYGVLYKKAQAIGGGTAWTGPTSASPIDTAPDLSPAQLATLSASTTTQSQRTVVMYGHTANGGSAPPIPSYASNPAGFAYDGEWQGYGYSGNSGQTAFQQGFWSCSSTNVVIGGYGAGTTLATNGASVECWTLNALVGNGANNCNGSAYSYLLTGPTGSNARTCYFRNAPTGNNGLTGSAAIYYYDATCYQDAALTIPGKMLRVTWSDEIGTGSNRLKYRVVGRFFLLCYFRGASGVPGANANPSTNYGNGTSYGKTIETCTSGTNTYQGHAMGTVVGVVQGISSAVMETGTVLGNTPGDIQKLVLVK